MTTSATAATLTAGLTVPVLSKVIDCPLDRLRTLINRHPSLSEQFVRVGPLRVLPPEMLPAFRERLAELSGSPRGRAATCPPSSGS